MPLIKADRVKETSTSTGATTFALAGAVVGFRAFSSVCSVGDTFYYVIDSDSGSEWETGLGTYSATNTLTRTTVFASSNSGSIVTFSAGTKNVYISLTARQIDTISAAPKASTGSPPLLERLVGAAHTELTATTEYNDIYWVLARAVQFSTGAVATQRAIRIAAPTYSFVGASTITNAATVQIDGAPVAGTSATITNSIALRALTGQAAAKGIVVQGAASQTGNLQEWQNSSSAILAKIESNGSLTAPRGSFLQTVANSTALSAQAAPQAINTVGYSLLCSNSDGLTTLQLIHDGRFSITQRPSGGYFRNACLTVTASADTPTLAAGNNDFYFNANATETSLASNYSGSCSVMEIACRTYAATSGTATVTDAYGVYIPKVPTAGSNVTIQRSYGIYVISDKNYSIGLAIGASAAATSKGIQIQRTSGSGTGTNFEVVNGAGGSVLMSINHNGSITPATLADASASNNSIYYSSTAGKLVYKDSAGTVNNLY